jgi:hypothetical protein
LLLDLVGKKSAEDGVPRIGRGRRQDGNLVVERDVEELAQDRLDRKPLVEPHAVDDDEGDALPRAEVRHHPPFHDIDGEGRAVDGARTHPALVGGFHVLAELDVQLPALVGVRLAKTGIAREVEFHVPLGAPHVDLDPASPVGGRAGFRARPGQLRDVVPRELILVEPVAVQKALQREEDLHGADRLEQVVADAAADRLVHERLRLVLCDQDHGKAGVPLLDRLERFEAAAPRHRLIEEHGVEFLPRGAGHRVVTVRNRRDAVSLLLQEQNVGAKELDLVVGPEDLAFVRRHGI